jgi:proteasome accessory factor A
VLQLPRGATYCLSQRAAHIWDVVSPATARSVIDAGDQPYADAERFRRLRVTVGDSNMSEATMLLKVGATDLVLRMIEAGAATRDLTLDNPIRAIREVSHDLTGRSPVQLADGRQMSAVQIQSEYLTRASDFTRSNGLDPARERVLQMWQRVLGAIETGNLEEIAGKIDWVTKYQLIERYRARHDLPLSAPRIAQLDLAYHDLRRDRGLYYLLQRDGAVDRVTRDLDIFAAKSIPPQTTRAKLRGEFIRQAQERRRPFAVDWVHLKLNDRAQLTVLCKDPFRSVDARVDRLIARL